MKITPVFLLCGALMVPGCLVARAQDDAPKTAAKADPQAAEKAKLDKVQAGELRLEGKVTALLGADSWQMQAISWTSPRGVVTNFDEPKSKGIALETTTLIHERGEIDPIPVREVKIGARIAIIGKNGADGSLVAREVILLEKLSNNTVGTVRSNPFTNALVDQSRAARAAGQLPKALDLIEKAIASAKGQNDLSGEGLASQDKFILLADLRQYKPALETSNRVVAIGRQLGNSLLLSLGLSGSGRLLLASGQTDKALTNLKEADTLSAPLDAGLHRGILGSLASAYLIAGQLQNGVATLNRVAPLEDAAGKPEDSAETLLQVAALTAPERSAAARQTITDMQGRIDRARDEKTKANLIGDVALVKWRLGDKDEARTGFTQAAQMLTAANASADAKRWEGMAAALDAADENWQSFFRIASGLNALEVAQKEDGETPPVTDE